MGEKTIIILLVLAFFIYRDMKKMKSKENTEDFLSNFEFPELLAQVKKLELNIQELPSIVKEGIVDSLDVVGNIPNFFHLTNVGYCLYLAIDDQKSFSFIATFFFVERYDNKTVELITATLNRDQDNYPFPIYAHCENRAIYNKNENNSMFYFYTPFFQNKDDFEEILTLFSIRLKFLLESFFGSNIPYPKFIAKRLMEAEEKKI